MAFRNLSIKSKVMAVIMVTSVTALLMTETAFTFYDMTVHRHDLERNLLTMSSIVADNSTAAVVFQSEEEAAKNLSALRAERHIAMAALYDEAGKLFARYPQTLPVTNFPTGPQMIGTRYEEGCLTARVGLFEEGRRVGTLYIKSDLNDLYQRLRLHAGISLLVLAGSAVVALLMSNALQRRITRPILALAHAASSVAEKNDFSVRVPRMATDELGRLTEVFNQMLARLQETEEIRSLLAAIVVSSDDAIVGQDLESRVLSWNAGAERMLGYSAGEMLGQSVARLLPPDRPQEDKQLLEEVRKGGMRHHETVRIRKDGKPLDVALTLSPIRNAKGEIIGISSIARDITERKQTEQRIRSLNIELEERVKKRTAELTAANNELEAFTYSVAHDLRAPLRHIDAFGKILSEDFAENLPEEAQRYLQNIRNGSRNMSQLVDDLLNLARIGRQEVKQLPTPLNRLVDDVLADLKTETAGRNVEWHIEPLPIVECDPGLMRQAFANLLSNAVKYSRPREVAVIEVGSRRINGETALFVRDNGVGFNMKYADKLFGVFQRLHRAEEFEGTGVGLATVERIIRKHGGTIWAEAAADQGATFYFTVKGLDKPKSSAAGANARPASAPLVEALRADSGDDES